MWFKLSQNWRNSLHRPIMYWRLIKNCQRNMVIWCFLAELLELKVPKRCWREETNILHFSSKIGSEIDSCEPAFKSTNNWTKFSKTPNIQLCMYKNYISINPVQAGLFWNHIGWGAHCAPPCFSSICCPITTKLGMLVLWHKISQKQ